MKNAIKNIKHKHESTILHGNIKSKYSTLKAEMLTLRMQYI